MINNLFNALRDKAVTTVPITTFGLTKAQFVLAYDPRISGDPARKENQEEVVFVFQTTKQDVQIGSYDGIMYITVYLQDAVKSRDCGFAISQALQGLKMSNTNITLWRCFYVGGPPMSVYDEKKGLWSTTLAFDIRAK